jgi:ubiquitin C-terminal hydrolase
MSQEICSGVFTSIITTDQIDDDTLVTDSSVIPKSGQLLYSLESLIVHEGSAKAGHFYCYARSINGVWKHKDATNKDDLLNSKFGKFYKFDDCNISSVRIGDLKDSKNQNVSYVYKLCR